MTDAPDEIWIDWSASDSEAMPASILAHTARSRQQAAHSSVLYRRADLPHPDDAARIAALEEANARLAVALAESQTREANAHRAYLHAIGAAPE